MKDFWDDLKARWESATPAQQAVFGWRLTMLIGIMMLLMSALGTATPSESTKAETKPEATANEDTFPANEFYSVKLTSRLELGTWDGHFVRSIDGEHCASVDEYGRLWLDCEPYGIVNHTNPRSYYSIDTVYLGTIGIKFPFLDGDIVRYNPEQQSEQVLVTGVQMALGPVKVAPDKVRYVELRGDLYRLIEIDKTGNVDEICVSPHSISIRALADYPERGDLAEFWLLRKAYTSGEWDGSAKKISDVANLVGINLQRTTTIRDQSEDLSINYRDPDLRKLDFVHTDPRGLAAVTFVDGIGPCIVIDNVPKYYIHATAPFLVDDVAYRNVKNLSFGGFVEIDALTEPNILDQHGWPKDETPRLRFSYALSQKDYANIGSRNPTTTAVVLPYCTKGESSGIERPKDFLENLEILDARNDENNLRAVVLGYASSADVNDPESTYTVYLSRNDSRFTCLAEGVINSILLGNYSYDYVYGDATAPLFDDFSLTLYGREKFGYLPSIFSYNNELVTRSYEELRPESVGD